LVVGFGNSGGEIAIDLWEHDAKPGILCRSPVNVLPRSLVYCFEEILDLKLGARGGPLWVNDRISRFLIKLVVGDLSKYGITTPHPIHGVTTNLVVNHVPPFLDIGTIDLIKKGEIQVFNKGIKRFTKTAVIFEDDREETFDDVILATGFEFASSCAKFLDPEIHAKVTHEGIVVASGKESAQKHMYFLGYADWAGRFREIHLESIRITKEIEKKLRS